MSIQVFENQEFRLQVTPADNSFRVEAPGLAKALGFHSARDMVRSIPEAEKGWELSPTLGGSQQVWFVTEAGFYRAVGQRQTARIKDAGAREKVARFQNWVYGDVLPSIRRTGGYQAEGPTAVGVDLTITTRLAEIAHRDLVVPASARILAYQRWNKPQQGMAAFGEVCIQLELDIRPLGIPLEAGIVGQQAELPAGDPEAGR